MLLCFLRTSFVSSSSFLHNNHNHCSNKCNNYGTYGGHLLGVGVGARFSITSKHAIFIPSSTSQIQSSSLFSTTSDALIETNKRSHTNAIPITPYDFQNLNYKVPPPISDGLSSSPSSIEEEEDINNNENVVFNLFPSEEELSHLPKGSKGGHKVVRTFTFQFQDSTATTTTTLQEALTLLDPSNYPSLTRARKAIRKGSILIHRGPILLENHNDDDNSSIKNKNHLLNVFCSNQTYRGRVSDPIYDGDIIGIQIMMGTFKKKRCYPNIQYTRPRFTIPIVYEDDHMAIVDKPAGIGMYARFRKSKSGNLSRRTVRDILPYVLTPPSKEAAMVGGALKRPQAVHRLDTPTNGLVVVAKTKLAMDSFYRQFQERRVKKTYHAIVNGIPVPDESVIVKDDNNDHEKTGSWNIINYPLGNKQSITLWKILRSSPSLLAKDGTLTLVEVRPHTGRYHQIRRHMAWICQRPLVGDALYAGNLQAPRFRRNGLYLTSNGITLDHPFYTSANMNEVSRNIGREKLDFPSNGNDNKNDVVNSNILMQIQNEDGSTVRFIYDKDEGVATSSSDIVQISVAKCLPKRFTKLLDGEESWARRVLSRK